MARIILIVLAVGLILSAGGFVFLGAFPPEPKTHPVEKTLPNDKFQAR